MKIQKRSSWPSAAHLLAALAGLGGLALVIGLLSGPRAAARPSAPVWELGTRFAVEYRLPLVREGKEPGGRAGAGELVHVVQHEVVAVEQEAGRQQLRLRAVSDRLDGSLDYVIDAERGTLLRVEESLASGEQLTRVNPFGLAPVLFQKRSFRAVLADMPELDEASVGSRRVVAPEGAYPAFEQILQPDRESGWLVTLRRHDPESDAEYRVTQRWRSGEPWWRSAEVRLGERVILRGQRLDAVEPVRLHLPFLLHGELPAAPE